jgi:hypothetical protein
VKVYVLEYVWLHDGTEVVGVFESVDGAKLGAMKDAVEHDRTKDVGDWGMSTDGSVWISSGSKYTWYAIEEWELEK